MHVRGFTRSDTSKVQHPGTYLGVIEKIPFLKSLGVTAVELMPVHEFPSGGFFGKAVERANYWGYDPLAFFAPHSGYAFGKRPGAQVVEFKQMVKALHQAGIEVILDVVFNHTCEGNELGPTLSFKGLENHVYYMLDNGGSRYKNYSGCGNTVNGNHPIVREMIFHCLRHWVHNFHVDGFRFDLASILSRDRNGNLVPNPPLVEAIAEDPLLADTKIIAEAWDAAGAYQVGSFGDRRWAE
jgi:glycogen operon protein